MLPPHRFRVPHGNFLFPGNDGHRHRKDGWKPLPEERPYHHLVGARPTIDNGGSVVDTLMVRKIDDLGRVVVPAETRRLFNIHEGDELAITVENGGIVLRKLDAVCVFCGSEDGVADFEDRGVCKPCREKISVL
jgi:transcriptional pleiotropic regulator of transition state genes